MSQPETAPDTVVQLRIYGTPMPQGSKTAFVRGGKPVLTDGRRPNARQSHAAWRQAVATAARDYLNANNGAVPWDDKTALTLSATFLLAKPKSTPKSLHWHRTRPDLSKLVRTVEDALTDAALIVDDARISHIVATKQYAIGVQPGAIIDLSVANR